MENDRPTHSCQDQLRQSTACSTGSGPSAPGDFLGIARQSDRRVSAGKAFGRTGRKKEEGMLANSVLGFSASSCCCDFRSFIATDRKSPLDNLGMSGYSTALSVAECAVGTRGKCLSCFSGFHSSRELRYFQVNPLSTHRLNRDRREKLPGNRVAFRLRR